MLVVVVDLSLGTTAGPPGPRPWEQFDSIMEEMLAYDPALVVRSSGRRFELWLSLRCRAVVERPRAFVRQGDGVRPLRELTGIRVLVPWAGSRRPLRGDEAGLPGRQAGVQCAEDTAQKKGRGDPHVRPVVGDRRGGFRL